MRARSAGQLFLESILLIASITAASSPALTASGDREPPPAVGAGRPVVAPDGVTPAEQVAFDETLPDSLLHAPEGVPVRLADWPVAPGRRGNVVVRRRDVYAPGSRLYAVEAGGLKDVPHSKLAFLFGELEGDPDTRVLLSVDPDRSRLVAFARTSIGWTELRPSENGTAADYLVAPSSGFLKPATNRAPFQCGAEALSAPSTETLPTMADTPTQDDATALRQATIAVDTDNEFMSLKFQNNVTNATNYVAQLVALMSVIYERDVQVRLLQGTTFFRASTTADPYAQSGTGNADEAKLNEFASYWSPHYASVPRALAMMLSGKQGSTTSASGIGFINTLCSTSSGYSFSQVFRYTGSDASSDRDLVGHELGHNFGSVHTHCYDPPIDTCWNQEAGCYAGAVSCPAPQAINGVTNVRGTIMSYCDNLSGCSASGVFHPRTVAVLNPLIAAKTGVCVFPATVPAPREASPHGDMHAQRGAGESVVVTYTPACGATQHTVYAGSLSTLHTGGIAWTDRVCSLGTSGSFSFTPTRSVYFVVVGNDGTNEGSYGRTSTAERPPAGSGTPCAYTQELTGTCP